MCGEGTKSAARKWFARSCNFDMTGESRFGRPVTEKTEVLEKV